MPADLEVTEPGHERPCAAFVRREAVLTVRILWLPKCGIGAPRAKLWSDLTGS